MTLRIIPLITFFSIISNFAISCGIQSNFAEINYEMDSTNRMLIHFTIRTVDTWYCGAADSISIYQYPNSLRNIPLTDTFNVEQNSYLKIYKGDYLIDTLTSDSMAIISCIVSHSLHSATNMSSGTTPVISVGINCKSDSILGSIKSLSFNGARIAYGVWNDSLTYNPEIIKSDEDSVSIHLISPLNTIYLYPYQREKAAFPTDTMYITDSTGAWLWLYPRDEGYYDILYEADQYRKGQYIGYIMRNMYIYIQRDSSLTGLIKQSNQVALQCYPSPTSGFVTIDMSRCNSAEKQVDIYNVLGQVVFHTSTHDDKYLFSGELIPGMYTVSVEVGGTRSIVQFAKE